MVAFAVMNLKLLQSHEFVATGTTGGLIKQACSQLKIKRLKSGPLGGDLQIGALIAEGKVDGLIFFVDPLTPMPHDVDVKALMRVALVYDIPMALNKATAELLLDTLLKSPTKPKAAKGHRKQDG